MLNVFFPHCKDTLDKMYINSSILRQSTFLACFGVISRPRNSHLRVILDNNTYKDKVSVVVSVVTRVEQ